MNTETLKQLQNAQRLIAEDKAALAEAKAAFDAEMQPLRDSLKNWQETEAAIKEALTADMLAYTEAGNGKKHPSGIGLRVSKTMDYSAETALEWAKENSPAMLVTSLNKKSFEALAKTQELPFVEYGEKQTVTFPKAIKLVEVA